jgi:uncharacterized LabA/DUF88 family protein
MARVIVFIDNSNVYKHLADLCVVDPNIWCKQYDPKFLAEKLSGNRELVRVMFYCAPPPQSLFQRNPQAYARQNSYYEKVKTLSGVEVKYATLTTNSGQLSEKNLDTQLTADMVVMAATNQYDQAIIVSNDGDFVSAVDGAKTQGKKIEVAHFKQKFSMDLRQSADITRRLRPVYFRNIFTGESQQSLI